MNERNFRTLDLNLLRVFDEVMAERSLTKAAHKLSITQPAVSNAMRRLREVVGDELMVRSGMSVAPGMTLARINGLGTVWLEVALPVLTAFSTI